MAVDSYYSAASMSPAGETVARQQLVEFPARIARSSPKSPALAYAALQGVRADYMRRISENPANAAAARAQLCEGLVAFAAAYPHSVAAPDAVLEAAQAYEALGRPDDARRSYRYLADRFPTQAAAKTARASLWRLAGPGTPVPLDLPPLYPTANAAAAANPDHSHTGKVVVAYFWSSTTPQAAADLQTLRDLSDRYQDRGLEVVCVDVDADPAQARVFLAGKLTAGEQLYQPGGQEGAAEHYGISSLPSAIVIAGDGTLARHSVRTSQLEKEITKRLPGGQ
jgi:hypothetical protein